MVKNVQKHPQKIYFLIKRRAGEGKDMGAAGGRRHEVPLDSDGRQPTHARSIV